MGSWWQWQHTAALDFKFTLTFRIAAIPRLQGPARRRQQPVTGDSIHSRIRGRAGTGSAARGAPDPAAHSPTVERFRVPPVQAHSSAISVQGLSKTYASGFKALKDVDLEIEHGEIFALLGPNGAGKTTLINIICGIVNPTSGRVTVGGHDIVKDFRKARAMIGLVPQEMATDTFESVWATTSFSRGLFGKPANPAHIEKVLKSLSLWDKKDSRIMTLSGGMKRRVLIAKALAH